MKKQIVHYALRSFLILFLASLSQALHGATVSIWNNTGDWITFKWAGSAIYDWTYDDKGNKRGYVAEGWVDYLIAPKTSALLSGFLGSGVAVKFKGDDANKYYFLGENKDTYSELNLLPNSGDWKVSIQKK